MVLASKLSGRRFCFAEISLRHIGGSVLIADAILRRNDVDIDKNRLIVLRTESQLANGYVYELLRGKLQFIDSPLLNAVLSPLTTIGNKLNQTHRLRYLNYQEARDLPLFEWFGDRDRERAADLLSRLGLNGPGAWFVCFFARDNAYSEANFSTAELASYKLVHECRNSDISTHIKAMQFILEKGGHVVRIGRTVRTPLGYSHPNLIDYPYSDYVSDFADICLVCNCKFVIGDAAGIVDVSSIAGVPHGRVNEPLYSIKWRRPRSIFIPKLVRSIQTEQVLSLSEYNRVYDLSMPFVRFLQFMRDQELTFVQNTEDDILQVTEAMYRAYVLGERGTADAIEKVNNRVGPENNGIWPEFLIAHTALTA